MEAIEIITYIKSVSKKEPSIDRIKPHLLKIGDENVWSIENLPTLLHDICNKGLIELVDDSYKMKQTKERKLVEETLAELTSQCEFRGVTFRLKLLMQMRISLQKQFTFLN